MLEIDIRKYFGTVDHEFLLDAVNEEVSNRSVLRLLRMSWEAGVLEDGMGWTAIEQGTPQGGVISPCWTTSISIGSIGRWPSEGMTRFVM